MGKDFAAGAGMNILVIQMAKMGYDLYDAPIPVYQTKISERTRDCDG